MGFNMKKQNLIHKEYRKAYLLYKPMKIKSARQNYVQFSILCINMATGVGYQYHMVPKVRQLTHWSLGDEAVI